MDKELLRRLCETDGVSGREDAVRALILQTLDASAAPHEKRVDAMGNIIVHLFGKRPAKQKLLLDAHVDEVGVLVTRIEEDGFLRFSTVGGIDKQVLYGHRVRFGEHTGVIGGKAVHQCSDEERKDIPEPDAMAIDLGAESAKETSLWVSVGDFGTFDEELTINGDIFCGKAVDDRIGCALLLTLCMTQPPFDIWVSFSVQEEIGARGAGVVAETVVPDIAIALDATTAADTVGSTDATAVCRLGEGAVVSFADRGTLYDPDLYRNIRAWAAEQGIPTQTKTKVAGGNNSSALQTRNTGARVAAVSLPCRYIHSPVCTGSLRDVQAMEDLLRVLIARLPA